MYLSLLILSLIYYKERVIFSDVSFILFNLITEGGYAIQVHRFVSIFTQSFGLFASKLGLPLNWVAMIHSAGFVMYYFTVFLLLLKVIKNHSMALGLLLFNILMVTMSFYWIPSELIQGMAFVFLYHALMEKQLSKKTSSTVKLITFSCLFTAIFAHPLIIFATMYAALYLLLQERRRFIFFGIQLFLMVTIYLSKSKLLPNAYDNNAKGGLNNITKFLKSFDLSGFDDFFQYLIGDYIFLTIGAIGVLLYYFFTKQILKALLFIGFFIGYSIVVNIGQAHHRAQYYIESQYLILSFYVIIPWVKEILPKVKHKSFVGIIGLVALASLARIHQAHIMFTNRLEWQRAFLKQTAEYHHPKIVINKDQVPMDILLEHWGSGYEFWLLSTIETGRTRSIVISNREDEFDKHISSQSKKTFIAKWNQRSYEQLNQRYFILCDTSSYYQKWKRNEDLVNQQ